jgi:hypothetical protein
MVLLGATLVLGPSSQCTSADPVGAAQPPSTPEKRTMTEFKNVSKTYGDVLTLTRWT